MKIAHVNVTTGTFDFVDVRTGEKVLYQKLKLDDVDVVAFHCSSFGAGESVVFVLNEGDIVKEGNTVTYTGGHAYTTHAVLKYKLENGVLTILNDPPVSKGPDSSPANNSPDPVAKPQKPPLQTLNFKGGTCRLKNAIVSSFNETNTLSLILDYTLDNNTSSNVLDVLQSTGKIVAPDGRGYEPSQEPLINEESHGYILTFKIPKSIAVDSLKYIFEKQELSLKGLLR
jgi:hypothetical protein